MLVKNGTVVLKAKSDLRGYIAGQIIKVYAEIENRSDKSTGHVVASLMQVRKYPHLNQYVVLCSTKLQISDHVLLIISLISESNI